MNCSIISDNCAKHRFCFARIIAVSLCLFAGWSQPERARGQNFTRITTGDVVQDSDARGVSWADFDFDGDLDLFVTSFGKPNAAYRNNGDGTFAKITGDPIVSEGGNSTGCSWGDYDNDFYLDLFVANGGGQNSFLYHNNGNGTFTKIDTGAIVEEGGASSGGAWGDYDNDGYVDLFVANGGGQQNFLYRNNGDGTFTKIATGAIASEGGSSAGGTWVDLDGDGDVDLFVAGNPNLVYRNNGGGNFTKIPAGDLGNGASSSASSWADFDNDGDLDVFVADGNGANDVLYSNNGKGEFTQITSGPVVSDNLSSVGSSWGDFDNDGDVDLFVSNLFGAGGDLLYSNDGDGNFTRITNSVVANKPFLNSHGAAWADYDNDGNLDLLVATATTGFGNLLYHNDGSSNNWINIQCFGTLSNTAAIGAKVKVKAVIGEKTVWQTQEISSQTGIFSQNSLNAEFGLGDATSIDSLRVEWPSKTVTILTNVVANQFLFIDENRPPIMEVSIPDTTLVLSAAPVELTIELNNYFFDPEEGPLTFSASSSNSRVAVASVSGDTLTVAPKDTGLAAILVRADDGHGGVTADTFNVNVVRRNQPPVVSNKIPDVTLVASNPAFRLVVDLSNVFFDPDRDALTYSAQSQNNAIASAQVDGNVLTVTPGISGTTTIMVTAEDIFAATVTDTFKVVTVSEGSRPTVKTTIPDTVLVLGRGESLIRDLNAAPQVFSDTTGSGILTYSAASSRPSVATARIVPGGSTLQVDPVSVGTALITVTAVNSKNLPNSTSFIVSVTLSSPPVIVDRSQDPAPLGQNWEIVADISDDQDTVLTANLFYRMAGENAFTPIAMAVDPANATRFKATIPGSAVTSRGVEYFITAADHDSIRSQSRLPISGVASIRVSVSNQQGLVKPTPQPAGDAQTAYRLVSVPINLVNPDALAIFTNNLGPYDRKKWRVVEWRGGDPPQIAEPPNASIAMLPGKAVWLITKDGGTIDTGPGVSVSTSKPYAIPLHRDWNLIANPYNFPIPIGNLRLNKQDVVDPDSLELISFSGQWEAAPVLEILPFEGYALEVEKSDTLYVDPIIYPPSSQFSKPVVFANAADGGWAIRILAQVQQARDLMTIAGIGPAASSKWDRMDRPEPPGVGEYVSVYFSHPEWEKSGKRFRTDYRPAPRDAEEWDFEIETNIRDEVRLNFEGITSVPAEYEVWLVDKALQITRNLRENNLYSVAGRGPDHAKQLTLVVSKRGNLNEEYAKFQEIPNAFELSPNFPNPFNPATTIHYALPKTETVTLRVYNLLGEVVATLVDNEQKEAGHHAAIWNGRNAAGNAVANGVYFYRLRAGSFVQTRKMVLVE